MAGMGLWLVGRRAQAKGTSWMTGWVAGATREVTGGAIGGLEVGWTLFYRVENACRPSIQI